MQSLRHQGDLPVRQISASSMVQEVEEALGHQTISMTLRYGPTRDRAGPHVPGMDRRRFVLISLAAAFAGPLAAEAQQAGKVYRVGVLTGSAGHTPRTEAFRSEMSALGVCE